MPTRHVLLALCVLLLARVPADAEQAARTPRPPRAGGASPFRDRGFGGSTIGALSIDQQECPLFLEITGLTRDDRGVTVAFEATNIGDGAMTRQVVVAWVLAADGAVRGQRRWEGRRTLEMGGARRVDLSVANAMFQPGDVVVLTVQETAGEAEWTRDPKALEADAKSALRR